MALQTVPAEILLLIADRIPSLRDLSSWARTSRSLYWLLNEYLYRRVIRHGEELAFIAGIHGPFLDYNGMMKSIFTQASVDKKYYSSLKLFLKYGLPVDMLFLDRRSLLMHAIDQRSYALAKLLLEHGADPSSNRNGNGRTPLHCAVEHSEYNLARLLLAHGADVNGIATDGTRPLFQAILGAHHDLIRLLIENGADINAPVTKSPRDVPLRLARKCYHGKVMKFLIAAGAHTLCISDAEEKYLRKHIK
jgi:hypothetical protein